MENMLVVLNKVDQFPADQREERLEKTRRGLQKAQSPPVPPHRSVTLTLHHPRRHPGLRRHQIQVPANGRCFRNRGQRRRTSIHRHGRPHRSARLPRARPAGFRSPALPRAAARPLGARCIVIRIPPRRIFHIASQISHRATHILDRGRAVGCTAPKPGSTRGRRGRGFRTQRRVAPSFACATFQIAICPPNLLFISEVLVRQSHLRQTKFLVSKFWHLLL